MFNFIKIIIYLMLYKTKQQYCELKNLKFRIDYCKINLISELMPNALEAELLDIYRSAIRHQTYS